MGYSSAMFKECLLANVKCSKPGNTKKVGEESGDWKRTSKKLLDCPEYTTICAIETETRKWFKVRAVPGEFFKEGCYLLNKSYIEESKNFCNAQREKLANAVSNLLAVYELRIDEAKANLEPLGLFDLGDYPAPAAWNSKCRIKTSYTEISVPDELQAIDPELYAQQVAEADAEWKRAIEDVRLALLTSMGDTVSKLCKRLEPDAGTGTAKSIKTSTFNQLDEFLTHFEKRDCTNSAELAQLVKKAREVLGNVDAEKIRTEVKFSDGVKKAFDELNTEIVKATEEQAVRLISFDLDEAA